MSKKKGLFSSVSSWFGKSTANEAQEKIEAEKLETEKLETEKIEAEKIEAEKIEAKKIEADLLLAEKRNAEEVTTEAMGKGDDYYEVVMFDQDDEEKVLDSKTDEEKALGFFARFKRSLAQTRLSIGSGLFSLFKDKKIDDDLFEELEEQLIIADMGVDTTLKIIDNLTQHADRKQLKDAEALYTLLKSDLSDLLQEVEAPLKIEKREVNGKKMPFVILMVGVNGVGKTTTTGKLAKQYQEQGLSVMLAAGDTFRAAAVEQLQV